jgi:Phage capsid family
MTRVLREPLTYERHAAHSYFADLALGARGDARANNRLARHADEMRVEVPKREMRAFAVPGDIETRTTPSRTGGAGGSFSPPLWLIDEFASVARPKRVLSAKVPTFGMPAGAQSISLPQMLTGTKTGEVADLQAVPDGDVTDSPFTSPVMPIAGQADIALQLLEQSPRGAHFDWVTFRDLTEDYDAQLESYVLYGTGAGGQFYGITRASGVNTVTYTDASPTGSEMFPFIGQALAKAANARKMPPETWLATTSRWVWLGTQEDNANRPLVLSNHEGLDPIGSLVGFPVSLDEAITTTNGQDTLITGRPSDMILLESLPQTSVMFEPLSGELGVRLQLHGYTAFLNRYPSGVAVVSGTGMTVQTGF